MNNMSIGKILREAREKKKMTINQAYEHTRIHPDVLKALEEDAYERILNPAYIKSFLKGYASYLGLDANNIIEEYDKLEPEKPEEKSLPAQLPLDILKKTRIPKALPKKTLPLLKWVIILALAAFVSRGVFRFVKTRVVARAAIKVSRKKAVSKKPSRTPARKSSKTPKAQDTALKRVVIPKDEALLLTLDVTDDVWLRLKVDGRIIFESILRKGASETWEANENFTIWTGRAHALRLSLNGSYIGTAGNGVVKNLVIDRRGMRR